MKNFIQNFTTMLKMTSKYLGGIAQQVNFQYSQITSYNLVTGSTSIEIHQCTELTSHLEPQNLKIRFYWKIKILRYTRTLTFSL